MARKSKKGVFMYDLMKWVVLIVCMIIIIYLSYGFFKNQTQNKTVITCQAMGGTCLDKCEDDQKVLYGYGCEKYCCINEGDFLTGKNPE